MSGRRQSGLSVLELLVALALLAMIAATLASTVTTSARVWERSKTFTERDSQVLLRTELRKWLETMKPFSRPWGQPQEAAGTATRFRFLTTDLLMAFPALSETRVTIEVRGEGEIRDLWILLEGIDRGGGIVAREERLLAENLPDARIRYYDTDPDDPGWRDDWSVPRKRPALVSIVADVSPLIWPPLTVAPRLE